jgi:cytosine/adenosine deaminase-related metal-dependent hydrolase
MMQRRWKFTLNNPFNFKWPYVFHIGEGIDRWSSNDVDTLLRWNILRKRLIGVHGVAMDVEQAKRFEALIWCPASNYFMFQKTAPVKELKHHTTLLFGTDSTLTANWSIWSHLREALDSGMVNHSELIKMLGSNAARVWGLDNYGMKEGNGGDVVVAKKKSGDQERAFFEIGAEDILLVFCKGELKLVDESLLPQFKSQVLALEEFSRIQLQQTTKYVYGNLPALADEIKAHCPTVSFPFSY